MKLFQIEEPDGLPSDPDAPGAAIGIDASGAKGEVAFAVGGNAVALEDRDGFSIDLPAPPVCATAVAWQAFFESARLRAERALGRPVTHAVMVLATSTEPRMVSALLKVLAISVQGANQLISDDSSHHLFWRGTTHPPRDCPLLLLSQFHLQGHLPRHLREFLLGPVVRPAWLVCWIRITASSSFTLRYVRASPGWRCQWAAGWA